MLFSWLMRLTLQGEGLVRQLISPGLEPHSPSVAWSEVIGGGLKGPVSGHAYQNNQG